MAEYKLTVELTDENKEAGKLVIIFETKAQAIKVVDSLKAENKMSLELTKNVEL